MFRCCKQLLAWLSVAAFLFANAHAASALSAIVASPKSESQRTAAKRTCCTQCQAKRSKPKAQPNVVTIQAGESDHDSCPCCPQGKQCPDHCVLCSVAKALATVTMAQGALPSPVLLESWIMPVAMHLVAFHSDLMRPPRL